LIDLPGSRTRGHGGGLLDGEFQISLGFKVVGDADLAAFAVAEGGELVPSIGLAWQEGALNADFGLAWAFGVQEFTVAWDADVGDDVDLAWRREAGGVLLRMTVQEINSACIGREGGLIGIGQS
jgi:hypothetical protein